MIKDKAAQTRRNVSTETGQLQWNPRTGRIVRRYPVGGKPALSPDGRTLALGLNSPSLGAPSASVGVLDLRSGHRRELAHDLHEEWIMSLAFMSDGRRVAGAAFDGTYVWDAASGAIVERFRDEQTNAASGGGVVDRRGLVRMEHSLGRGSCAFARMSS